MPDELELLDKTDAELLNEEDEAIVVSTDDEDEEENEEEKEEEDKEKDDSEKEDDEKIKSFPFEVPSFSDIKAEYPEFFKKFPQFRDLVFQQVEYRKIFPTVDDAKESIEDSIALSGLRDSVLAGKSEDIFDAIKQTDETAASKFATTFLSTLYSKDQKLYQQAVTPLFESLVRTMGRNGDENTRNAAIVAARYLFGADGDDIIDGKKTFVQKIEDSEDAKKLKEERTKIQQEQYNSFHNIVTGEMLSGLEKLIGRGLDPDGSMSEYAKKTLVKDIIERVDKAMAADESHIKNMNHRWLRSTKEGLNTASKEKLVSAYLSRAKQVIPSIRDKARKEFLGIRKQNSDSTLRRIETNSSKTKEITSGRASSSGNKSKEVLKPSREVYRKMSDIDILNS